MADVEIPFFPHKLNSDGSYQSICLTCFATVGIATKAEDLDELDRNHVCKSTTLQRMGLVAGPRPNSVRPK
jgi:hypothetical protein